MINLYQTSINYTESKNVNHCLKTSWISSKGKFIKEFEKNFSKFTKIRHSITTSSGTSAIHLALLCLDIKKGDQIIVPSFTFVATVNPIRYLGATPVFIDSKLDDFQMNLDQLKNKINKNTKAIICPHIYGNTTNLIRLKNICKKNKLYLIEDCAEALGSFYKKKHVGNFGDIATFSFYGNKTITTGEGGMICTNKKFLTKKIIKLKCQGILDDKTKSSYFHDIIGYNYRMSNVLAGIGLAQLKKIKLFIKKKRKIFDLYNQGFNDNPNVIILKETENVLSSYWLNVILVKSFTVRQNLKKFLEKKGVETRTTFYPIHKMPMYKNNMKYINAEKLAAKGLCLPSYPDIKITELKKIIRLINIFFKQ